ncbi:MAG: glycine cleavage system protein GcvH [Candidatus Binatia bacterium]
MEFPDNLRYTKTHEWVRVEDDGSIVMGITDYAQDAMGDLVFIELPAASDESIAREEAFAVVESVKAVQDVYAPLTGRVTEVNDELPNTPEVLNQDPYGDGWMVRMEIENTSELEELMDVAAYEEMVGDLS